MIPPDNMWRWIRKLARLRSMAVLGCSFNLGVLVVLGWRLAGPLSNHWAFDHRYWIPFLASELLIAALVRDRVLRWFMLGSGVLALGLTVLSITENGLLPYNLWIRRGMPLKWQTD
jgi:hypothetical protein